MIKRTTFILLIEIIVTMTACEWSNKPSNDTPADHLTLNKSTTAILIGGSEQLFATVSPKQEIDWTSSNKTIATVSSDGLVSGLADGTVVITATSADGKLSDNCVVIVAEDIIPVSGISLNKTETSIYEGSTETLHPTIIPSDATNQNLIWSSSSEAIASVSANGVVTGIAAGSATVTVTTDDGNFTAECEITVKVVTVEGVTLDKETLSVRPAETGQLTATIHPSNSNNKNVTWKSSDTSIAIVSSTGMVTGVTYGSATITVTTEDRSFNDSCSVNVTKMWDSQNMIIDVNNTVNDFKLTTISTGGSLAHWREIDEDQTKSEIKAMLYTNDSWSTPVMISNSDVMCFYVNSISDNAGNIYVVWLQRNPDNTNYLDIWGNIYRKDIGWEGAQMIANTSITGGARFDSEGKILAVDSDNNVMLIYSDSEFNYNTEYNIYTIKYTSGSGWSESTLIESNQDFAQEANITTDNTGRFVATWIQGGYLNINFYSQTSGWGTPQIISSWGAQYTRDILFDSAGNGIVVWGKTGPAEKVQIWASRYTLSTGWSTESLVISSHVYHTNMAVDSNGNYIIASNGTYLCTTKYNNTTGWEEPVILNDYNSSSSTPFIHFDYENKGTMVYLYGYYVRARKYYPTTGWSDDVKISEYLYDHNEPHMSVDKNGNVHVVWEIKKSDGTYSLLENRYY